MLKVGLIGAGFMGGMHANVYQLLSDVELWGVADIEPDRLNKFKKHFGVHNLFLNAEELITHPAIDFVDLCIPTFLHQKFVKVAAQVGKHILCEKPIALTIREANGIIEATQKAQVKLMIAHCIRFWPEYVYLKKVYEKDLLGKLKTLILQRMGAQPLYGWQQWLLDPKLSGGPAIDLHIHDTDFILSMLRAPRAVFSTGFVLRDAFHHIISIFEYPKIMVVAEGGWAAAKAYPFHMAYRAEFEKGLIEYDSTKSPTLVVYPHRGEPFTPDVEGFTQPVEAGGNISQLGGYYNEIRYFVDHVSRGIENTLSPPQQARDSLAIVLSEIRSAKNNRKISIKI